MRKASAFFIVLLLNFALLYAQEEPPDNYPPPDGGDWDIYNQDNYSRGDQTFIISLGTIFPAFFINNGKKLKNNFSPPVGGGGTLSYNYYFNRHIFLGGELGGAFLPTISNDMFYGIFLGARTGYQFYWWRMEFPLNISLGMSWQRCLGDRYYGLYMKAGGAAYFRFNSEWSFGLSSNWYWIPEWTNVGSKNVDGIMLDVLLSARYHF